MSDKQMISAPRALLERIETRMPEHCQDLTDLQALLDASADTCVTPNGTTCPGDGVGKCKNCPTSQHQGEPVAYRVIFNDGECSKWEDGAPQSQDLYDVRDGVIRGVERAYAEQPAPVAVLLPSLKAKLSMSHDWDQGHSDGWKAYDEELKRLNPSL